eukprot:5017304-Pleurochrysis_carterae.AAC.1
MPACTACGVEYATCHAFSAARSALYVGASRPLSYNQRPMSLKTRSRDHFSGESHSSSPGSSPTSG